MRAFVALTCAFVVAACTPEPSAPPAATTTMPTASAASEPSNSPSAVPSPSQIACADFDLGFESMPFVVVHRASEPDRDELEGLNGTGTLGDSVFDRGDWHQPAPQRAIAVSRGEPLLISSFLDTDSGALPLCVASAVFDAAPFSPIGRSPERSALIRLAAYGSRDGGSLGFTAPSESGEWVVRVALTFATAPGPSRQESFFRLQVDVPAPMVGGSASALVACGRAGTQPPRAYLRVDGGPWTVGESGSFTWRGTAGDGPTPNGPRIAVDRGAPITLKIEDNVCAAWWGIQLAPLPGPGQEQEAIADMIPARPGYDNPGKANRFALDALPPGDWVVGASFEFADSKGNVLGQTIYSWNVVVH